MYRTVQDHLQQLEQRVSEISVSIMIEQHKSKRNQLEAELRAVESAIAHYRSALEIESSVLGGRSYRKSGLLSSFDN